MARKQCRSRGLQREIRRRQADTARRVQRQRQAEAAQAAHAQQDQLAAIRRRLHEAAARAAWERQLEAAMAKTTEFDWVPWGYELPREEVTQELPIVQPKPKPPHIRLVPQPAPRARSRWDAFCDRHPNLTRILAGAAA